MWSHSILVFFFVLLGAVASFPQNTRIVNGTDSNIRKYPFMVSIRGASGFHWCGATIIAPNWLLTAGHCVTDKIASQLSVQYAATETSIESSNVARIKRIIIHENYKPETSNANDIALLEIQGRLIYNYQTIAAVTLPESFFDTPQAAEGAEGILIGWGLNETGGAIQTHLQEVNLKIFSDEECNARHNGATTKEQICGGVDEGGMGHCNGDSGGPLLYQDSILVGIVSWSIKPCAVYPYPGVYTKVSHYVDWIYKNMI